MLWLNSENYPLHPHLHTFPLLLDPTAPSRRFTGATEASAATAGEREREATHERKLTSLEDGQSLEIVGSARTSDQQMDPHCGMPTSGSTPGAAGEVLRAHIGSSHYVIGLRHVQSPVMRHINGGRAGRSLAREGGTRGAEDCTTTWGSLKSANTCPIGA